MVGFRLGSYEEGIFEVVSAASCHHIPARAKELVQVGVALLGGDVGVVSRWSVCVLQLFELYLNQSDLPPFSSRDEEGYVNAAVPWYWSYVPRPPTHPT